MSTSQDARGSEKIITLGLEIRLPSIPEEQEQKGCIHQSGRAACAGTRIQSDTTSTEIPLTMHPKTLPFSAESATCEATEGCENCESSQNLINPVPPPLPLRHTKRKRTAQKGTHIQVEISTSTQEDQESAVSASTTTNGQSVQQWPPPGVDWYYFDQSCAIACGDCREILPLLPKVDLVLTDPPYGIQDKPNTLIDRPGGRRGPRGGMVNTWHPPSEWDSSINPEWCSACCTVSDVVLWFGHWRKREEVESAMLFPIRAEIIWNKDTHVGPPCPVAMKDERLWIFSRNGIKPARFDVSVWDEPIIPTWAYRHHKNEKPINLLIRAMSLFDAQTILDPFMGSGTTLRAAKDLGRKAIGIEINEEYCAIAVQRLRQEVLGI